MNPEYAAYCGTDPRFYDTPHHGSAPGAGTPNADPPGADAPDAPGTGAWYAPAHAPLPEGWERARHGDWLSLTPTGAQLPPQGWKIHVSAALDNAEEVLRAVVAVCLARRVPFKFVPSPALLLRRNAKYADRAGSGKFVTVYPPTEAQLQPLCEELGTVLAGQHGPDVLSDLRCGASPVHVRYGAFAARYCTGDDGRLVPALADPQGRLVPDPRGPGLRTPPWVTLPEFLRPHLAARQATGLADLPYAVEGALHFSNGGGVYAARDTRTGERVVLKEARPYAGLAADGADAVTRLGREREALARLAGLTCVPGVRDSFTVGGHHFLVLDHVPGTTLNTVFARRFPLSAAAPTVVALAEHTAWAHRLYAAVERAVAEVHARGVVIGDLHMSNVMVDEDADRVVLLDFEAASPTAEERRQVVANPAFVAPADRRGAAVDHYALACLRLALFLPLTTLFGLDRQLAGPLARAAAAHFPVTAAELAPAVAEIRRGAPAAVHGTPPAVGDWPRSRDSMVRALLASCTPEREDRCFPGDIAQFAGPVGGQSFGYGAAGVLYALDATGAPRCTAAEEWLLERAKAPASGSAAGFHDGLAGIAWTLDRLGHRTQARELALRLAAEPVGALEALTPDLHSGQAGIALALDDLARSAEDAGAGADAALLRTAADRCADAAVRHLADGTPLPRAGLLHGATGIALLLVRRYEHGGGEGLLEAAATALRRDLARCRSGGAGGIGGAEALMVQEGKRGMPYLGAGSAGMAMVLDDLLAHRPDPELAAARDALLRATHSAFYIQPGLQRGVAGLVLQLARTRAGDATDHAARRDVIARHVALLDHQAVPHHGELAFPGEQLMRLSMDLSTGTAGVLLALGSALGGLPSAHLPFLPPLRGPQTGPEPGVARK